MEFKRKVRKGCSQKNAEVNSISAIFAQNFASFAVKSVAAVIVMLIAADVCLSQSAPQILKVEPPSWWAGSSLNPVRLMIRCSNLKNARVQFSVRGVRVV